MSVILVESDGIVKYWNAILESQPLPVKFESRARATMMELCSKVVLRSEEAKSALTNLSSREVWTSETPGWWSSMVEAVQWLWSEEKIVAAAVQRCIEDGMYFSDLS